MAKICMNEACQATTTLEWKKGWDLKSGGFAVLCYNCGSAYENSVFCETFHLQESGWRECRLCGKRIHCGCIVSKDLHHYLDFGGIGCRRCSKKLENRSLRPIKVRNDDNRDRFGPQTANNVGDPQSSLIEDKMDDFKVDKGKLIQLSKTMIAKDYRHIPRTQSDTDASTGKIKKEGITLNGEVGIGFPDLMQQSVAQSMFVKSESARPALGVKDMYESLALPSLSFSLGMPLGTSNSLTPAPGGVVEGTEWNKVPPFEQGHRTPHILPKPLKTGLTIGSDANKGTISQTRVARPPAEGRGRSLLLPRYWPRITDQELQQISGELNSTIVPLFEKVLSASDAGRIGRLVLPKACAEEYFPPISQSEGLPIRIQDIKGKEWTFQFRFWPNNNSRMYVLEGVTPCIQNMQLQAGDTVTFSRIDPGGKLVIGFRKASNSGDMHDCQPSAISNGTASGDTFFPGFNDNLPTDGSRSNEGMPHRSNLNPEKKKTRNIGSKSKRLFMHNEDAIELRFTWEEAQELLRPSPSAKPTIVMIEDQIFEEYDEPPVFGKRTIFTAGLSGKQEQWAQCDSCFKWRRLPVDFLVPPKWTCAENVWDSSRCSCSATGELNATELEHFVRVGRDFKKQRITESPTAEHHHEPSGLDALATAAVLGEHVEDLGEPSTGATTKHPRHRPGCTCIVCIQPPSGKGRHKPTCICNVCLTVKRRFKTLMLRKKKRQSERESEIAQEKEKVETFPSINDSEINGTNQNGLCKSPLDNERSQNNNSQLDLNCDPNREEEVVVEGTVLEMCTGKNGITKPSPCLLSLDAGMSECHPPDKGCLSSIPGEHENGEHENKDGDS